MVSSITTCDGSFKPCLRAISIGMIKVAEILFVKKILPISFEATVCLLSLEAVNDQDVLAILINTTWYVVIDDRPEKLQAENNCCR